MRIENTGRDLPVRNCAGHSVVSVGIQRGRDVVEVHAGDSTSARWVVDVTEVPGPDEAVDVRGPYVHGRPGARFLYLSWDGVDADGERAMFRRAKLMLDPALLTDAAGATLVADLRLTMADGSPLCAAVRPPVDRSTVCPGRG
jgi:hypothetical protein